VSCVRALIIVDVQNDFRPCGPVPVAAADAVPRAINDYLDREPGYDHVVATQDYHINPGEHFSDQPDYSSSWPPHCKAGSSGADFHPDLDTRHIDAVFRKGANGAAYSGFEGVDENETPLLDWLRQRRVSEVDVVGVATDYCVRMTSEDAARAGFATRVLVDLTAGAAEASTTAALEKMRSAGVTVVTGS
jgi:nicotinamidase/pyrazinamidase